MMIYYPSSPSNLLGVFAIRYGKHKAHFFTQGSDLLGGGMGALHPCQGSGCGSSPALGTQAEGRWLQLFAFVSQVPYTAGRPLTRTAMG